MLVGEALVLPLGMWPECFAYAGGGAGAILSVQGDAGQRTPPRPRPAPPRWQVLPATHCRRRPWALAQVGGRRGRADDGVGQP